jgi:hypothetical protein
MLSFDTSRGLTVQEQLAIPTALIIIITTAVALSSCDRSGTAATGTETGATESAPPQTAATAAVEGRESSPGAVDENREGHDDACTPPNAGAPSTFTCEFDTQCVICHDGSSCGIVVNRTELERRGAECQREDAAECEYSAPRCCDGRCAICSY